ncbi:hypothetical protein AWH56_002780 [Anaerobacillus isosaccharinicus]|uniref:Uncharacterized protein n=1 Tax=Anaerobacillus isosaccharinicus TaxID=1532552 RepID=A0A1S2M7N4_9BACI|nr:hypothetical protein [Anaerobacillus isosaccharinicus]MBA5585031.1 hypothetical protein [Anaerobacillus isosaccharinicus]QOY36618.1 hypothetical protein AWH56_002780 [Anaerobacillus isosaccharinicus]
MVSKLPQILLGLIIVIAIFVLWYYFPKQVDNTFEGVFYQLGSENTDFEETVSIEVYGKLHRSILGKKRFIGTIKINDEILPPSSATENELEIIFSDNYRGHISYWLTPKGQMKGEFYGELFINNDFSKLTITKLKRRENGSAGWNGYDGLMISAPATSRTEGLKISNELMKNFLKIPLD